MTVKCEFTQYAINGFNVASPQMNDVAKMIQKMQSTDLLHIGSLPVYKIGMNVMETVLAPHFKHTSKSECDFYITDRVQTDRQINDAVRKQYGNICSIPSIIGKPAILTSVYDEVLISNGLQFAAEDFCEDCACSLGKNIRWHVLDQKKDIVVNKKLHQIYPKKTDAFPVMIQKLLQRTK